MRFIAGTRLALSSTLILCGLPLASASSQSQQDRETVQQSVTDGYLCNFAKVYHLKPGAHLSVRSGPGAKFPQTDQLVGGTVVYICDEQGDWLKISYGGENTPCGSVLSNGLDIQKAHECSSGWVNRRYINVLSG